MITRRTALQGVLGAGITLALPASRLFGFEAGLSVASVAPAKLIRPSRSPETPLFVPGGENHDRPADYVDAEWFAEGTDDKGRLYRIQYFIRMPRDLARFSGTVIVEPLHLAGIAPIYMYSSPYILRSGHAWVCVVSQKGALDEHIRPLASEHYKELHIEADPVQPDGDVGDRWAEWARHNQASNAILAQAGAAIKAGVGPFAGLKIDSVLLVGHSQTGWVSTMYINGAHQSHRLADGGPVFDGYFPSGFPSAPYGPRDVPLIQVLSDGDIFAPRSDFWKDYGARGYRRPDSDNPDDRFRLYELAGVPHMGTRYRPFSETSFWQYDPLSGSPAVDKIMNSLPHNELFNMALHHLVQWVTTGVTPPRAERIEVDADGYFVKDEHGNSKGGVRCAQMDVPRATYHPNPFNLDGSPKWGTVGTETPFSKEKMAELYGTSAEYGGVFDQRLEQLLRRGWLLPEDAPNSRAEAVTQRW